MSIAQMLQTLYTFVPQEVILILLGGITSFVMLEIADRKTKFKNKRK
tara:strand:+ start:1154 stop:1294 length:141 start_codon:yes stop_codon:yes gene_type:complete